MIKNKDNMQPTVNPKPLKVQRLGVKDTDGKYETVFIRNVSITPQELIRS